MKLGDIEYAALVEKRQREIRGNVSSVKMTEQECAAEISNITGGAVSSFEGETIGSYAVVPGGVEITLDPPKKKRGRPVGSKNRPKP